VTAIGAGGPAFGVSGPNATPPPEVRDGVLRLLALEPEHPDSAADFDHVFERPGKLSILRVLSAQRRSFIWLIVLVTVEALLLQSGPLLTQIGIDHGISTRNWAVVYLVGGLYIAAVTATALASRRRIQVSGQLAADLMYRLRSTLFRHLQRMSLQFFTEEKSGVLLTRMTSDITNLQQVLQDGLTQIAIQAITMLVVVIVLFIYNVMLALITLSIVLPLLAIVSFWYRGASTRGWGRVRDANAVVMTDLAESLAGVRTVAAFNRQRRNMNNHHGLVGQYLQANNWVARIGALYIPSSEIIGILGQAIVLFIGAHMVSKGTLSIGELTAFVLYVNTFFQPVQMLVQQYSVLQQGQASIRKIDDVLHVAPHVPERVGSYELPPVEGGVVLEEVSFGYGGGRLILRDVSLRISPGETVCFVGPTGAGKSTVAKLVSRLYDPTAGRILIDDHDIRDVTLTSLRRQFGVVPQEPFLFTGTVRENVVFGRPDASETEVLAALETVGLADRVQRLPMGLDAPVAERGGALSSGERQLLALARAFVANPALLVLDEATSNLDPQSEELVERALDRVLEGRTAIIVAHRLSTAMRADRIVVVIDGQIAEVGHHDELVANGGHYAGMFTSWQAQLVTS
jgi:ATP-binding cassette subfamily B protein